MLLAISCMVYNVIYLETIAFYAFFGRPILCITHYVTRIIICKIKNRKQHQQKNCKILSNEKSSF